MISSRSGVRDPAAVGELAGRFHDEGQRRHRERRDGSDGERGAQRDDDLAVPDRRQRRDQRGQHPEGKHAGAEQEQHEIDAHVDAVAECRGPRGDGKEREHAEGRQPHDPVPELEARQPDGLQDAQQRGLVLEALQRNPVEDAEDHDRRDVVLAERSEQIGRDQQPEQLRDALLLHWRVADDGRLHRGNGLRQGREACEGHHPRRHIEQPSALEQPPGLARIERAQAVQQRADEIGIDRGLEQPDIDKADRAQDGAALAERDADENARYAAHQHPRSEIHDARFMTWRVASSSRRNVRTAAVCAQDVCRSASFDCPRAPAVGWVSRACPSCSAGRACQRSTHSAMRGEGAHRACLGTVRLPRRCCDGDER
jgi:hypothetical protein